MNKKEIKKLLEEFFVDNRNIKKQIMPAYGKVINVMKEKLNHAQVYNEIDLRPRESRIMFEILRFHPEFETKWTKGCKFVYAIGIAKDRKSYSDVFIKSPLGNLESFSKKTIKQHLKKDKNSKFKMMDLEEKFNLYGKTSLESLKKEINDRNELGLCTKIFGLRKISINPIMSDFIFCDYCLARTGYNEFKCSNPLEQHITIDKKLQKSEYAPGIAATNVDEDDNRYSNYYITKQSIYTDDIILTAKILIYLLPGGKFRYLGEYKKDKLIIDKFSKNMKDTITYPIYKLKTEHISNFDKFFKSL
jgi:uncharacterized protein with NAD-binding domain and iron-sulfur cluster